MAKGYEERSLLAFQRTFGSEEACGEHLARQRWPEGFVCPRCGHGSAWYLPGRRLYDCQRCRHQTSLTAGTIFHRTRTPLVKWYWLLYRMAMDKVGVSVAEMQRLLEIPDYTTAWVMAHKVRKAMADRDACYRLAGLVELDEAFFGPRGKTRGRGSERKTTVLCAVSLYRDRAGQDRPGFAHLTIVADASAQSIEAVLERLGCGPTTPEGHTLLAAHPHGRLAGLWESRQGQGPGALPRGPTVPGRGRPALALGPPGHLQRQGRHPGRPPRGLPPAPPELPGGDLLPLQSPLLGEGTVRSPRPGLRVHPNHHLPGPHPGH